MSLEIFKVVIGLGGGLAIFLIVGWFTGTKEYGGAETKDDERSQLIKQKSIVSSWIFLLIILIGNVVYDFVGSGPLRFNHLSLAYLLLLIISYFVYFWYYSRRMK